MNFHPGVLLAVRRLHMNELDAARAVRDGELPSPHRFENMALFAMRITGTGAAYRRGDNNFVNLFGVDGRGLCSLSGVRLNGTSQ